MTSLQKQLAVIAANSTKQLDLKAQRLAHGKSLLFDSKVAVTQSFDTIYQICRQGFDELCLLDARFVRFGDNLFSEQAREEEREQMTAGQNKELDAVIESFLGLICPRLLLQPAQKAIEWLIRRFRIHSKNTGAFILAFLPYHATPLFLSMLGLLPSRIHVCYKFLRPYIGSVSNPPIHAICYAASHNPAFFAAFNGFLLQTVRQQNHSNLVITFWASIVSQAVEGIVTGAQSGIAPIRKDRLDNALLQILPTISDMLSIQGIPELDIAACMILTILASRVPLADALVEQLMHDVVLNWNEASSDARLVVLAALAQDGKFKKLPKTVCKTLLGTKGLLQRLELIGSAYKINKLVESLVLRCIERLDKSKTSLEFDLITTVLQSGYQLLNEQETAKILLALIAAVTHMDLQLHSDLVDREWDLRTALVTFFTGLEQSPLMSHLLTFADRGVSLEPIETKLQLNILPLVSIDSQDIYEHDSLEHEPSDRPSPQFDLSILSHDRDAEASFLQSLNFPLYPKLTSLFAQAYPSAVLLENLFSHPKLRRDEMANADGLFPSFLVRLACSSRLAHLRCAAIDALTATLENHISSHHTNFHLLVPYLLYALGDKSGPVRRAAAKSIFAISKHTDASSKPWPSQALYSQDVGNLVLDPLDSTILLDAILKPGLEECMASHTTITPFLISALTSIQPTKKSKKTDMAITKDTATRICTFLAEHAACTDLLATKMSLISILNQAGDAASSARTTIILRAFKAWASLDIVTAQAKSHEQAVSIILVNQHFTESVMSSHSDGLVYLMKLALGPLERQDLREPAQSRLTQIWPHMSQGVRGGILAQLVTTVMGKDPANNLPYYREQTQSFLRKLPLLPDDLVFLMDSLPRSASMPNPPAPLQRHTSSKEGNRLEPPSQEIITSLLQYTLVLELVETSTLESYPPLFSCLFDVLGQLQAFGLQTQSKMVYLRRLTINSLLAIAEKLKDTKQLLEMCSVIRTDLIVESLQTTSDSQLQNASLLLVSLLATWAPEAVLHHVMPIFTLMGSTILRQNDEYSAHVIDQTVTRVIPPLVTSLRKRSRDVVSGIADVIISFGTAYSHVPSHRRLKLYRLVVEALGPVDCLFAVVSMIINRHPSDFTVRRFIAELVDSFDAQIGLQMLLQYVDLVWNIFKQRHPLAEILFDLKDKDDVSREHLAEYQLEAISDLLQDNHLRDKIAASFHFESETITSQQAAYSKLMRVTIHLMQQSSDLKYHEAAKTLLSNVFRLLPLHNLIAVSEMLLTSAETDVHVVIVQTIATEIGHVKQSDKVAASVLIKFLAQLCRLVDADVDLQQKTGAISCLQKIVEKIGRRDPIQVLRVVPVVLGDNCLGSRSEALQASSLELLASCACVLREDMLPHFSQLMHKTVQLLQSSVRDESLNVRVHDAGFLALNSIMEHMAFVFSGKHLDGSLRLAVALSCFGPPSSARLRELFFDYFARLVPVNEIFSALERNFQATIEEESFQGVLEYYKLVKACLELHSKGRVLKNAPVLLPLIRKAFEVRWQKSVKPESVQVSPQESEDLELLTIDITLTMVLKINDAVFRPFYIQLVDWATFDVKRMTEAAVIKAEGLFNLFKALLYRLKGLVTNYMTYVLDFASQILQLRPNAAIDHSNLLVAIVGVLMLSFDSDEDEFWQSPTHFSTIAKPLVRLLDHPLGSKMSATVVPAITSLATAVAVSSDHCKAINSEILGLFRAESATDRLAAVKCQHSLTERLGNDWLVHLPEALPFMTELLEDEDEKVEKETRLWIQKIEEISGENIDDMLQ